VQHNGISDHNDDDLRPNSLSPAPEPKRKRSNEDGDVDVGLDAGVKRRALNDAIGPVKQSARS
jgi:hypothetical protein